ncbi:unnamed protein product [Albugo candida]|uniref:Uncharacterized protein n=1 Tax=Albugo candida TaxID=65357 RepID=A0A024GJB5_9STRA|nr:unnamed protein product [Albugo candida]CCI46622.1 unnamed protein product [Albugo candida]|eukprot:CCI43094.1 unnamed protein product [Albugo candida]
MTEETRTGYRGKCLYKTGKCTNERALKTSGVAHNLCDEHRNRQNEHQRRLDAKNRLYRKEKQTKSSRQGTRHAPYIKSNNPDVVGFGKNGEHLMTSDSELTNNPSTAMQINLSTIASQAKLTPKSSVSFDATPPSAVFLPSRVQSEMNLTRDFDGIVVPLPSVLKGQERVNFRTRVYQRIMDYMTEEFIRLHQTKNGTCCPSNSVDEGITVSTMKEDQTHVNLQCTNQNTDTESLLTIVQDNEIKETQTAPFESASLIDRDVQHSTRTDSSHSQSGYEEGSDHSLPSLAALAYHMCSDKT